MRITWYGHAAFLVETGGIRVILDPYRWPDAGGYLPIDESADVVAVSHENDRYHSHLGQIRPPFQVVRGLELPTEGREVAGIRFQSIRVFESPEKRPEDEVTILAFESEGLRVVFLGDLGHALTDDELAPLRGADILLTPAGGPPTIDFPLLPRLLEAIGPKVVIPMHYKTPKINLAIQPVESFFAALPDWPVDHRESPTLEVSKQTLPKTPTIVSLQFAR